MKDELIPEGEQWPCFVGSGECNTPARWWIDDGGGSRVTICAEHKKEFDALEKIVDEMPPDQVMRFAEAIARADGVSVSEVFAPSKNI